MTCLIGVGRWDYPIGRNICRASAASTVAVKRTQSQDAARPAAAGFLRVGPYLLPTHIGSSQSENSRGGKNLKPGVLHLYCSLSVAGNCVTGIGNRVAAAFMVKPKATGIFKLFWSHRYAYPRTVSDYPLSTARPVQFLPITDTATIRSNDPSETSLEVHRFLPRVGQPLAVADGSGGAILARAKLQPPIPDRRRANWVGIAASRGKLPQMIDFRDS